MKLTLICSWVVFGWVLIGMGSHAFGVGTPSDENAKMFYQKKCKSCHGLEGVAPDSAKSLVGKDVEIPTLKLPAKEKWAEWALMIETGKNEKGEKKKDMPAYAKKLKKEKLTGKDMVEYLKTILKKP